MFFFKKKNQKTFAPLARGRFTPGDQSSENFLLLFYKKEVLTSFS